MVPAVTSSTVEVILAYQQNGEALTAETGGPLRLVYLDEDKIVGWKSELGFVLMIKQEVHIQFS